jgi:hypothetical protein
MQGRPDLAVEAPSPEDRASKIQEKTREHLAAGMRLGFEVNVTNLFNQRAGVSYYEFGIPTNLINPARAKRFQGDLGVDWTKVMTPYNYVDALNGTGAFAGNAPGTTTRIQSPLTLASRYGLPQVFQQARNLRLAIRFTF